MEKPNIVNISNHWQDYISKYYWTYTQFQNSKAIKLAVMHIIKPMSYYKSKVTLLNILPATVK